MDLKIQPQGPINWLSNSTKSFAHESYETAHLLRPQLASAVPRIPHIHDTACEPSQMMSCTPREGAYKPPQTAHKRQPWPPLCWVQGTNLEHFKALP